MLFHCTVLYYMCSLLDSIDKYMILLRYGGYDDSPHHIYKIYTREDIRLFLNIQRG